MTAGGCLVSRTSTGSLDIMHMTWSLQTGDQQQSESEQSSRPSGGRCGRQEGAEISWCERWNAG